MSEPAPESKSAGMAEPEKDPWRAAFDEFKTRDEKMVKDYQEEIDTLLVFVRHPHHLFIIRLIILALQAGLFSAVLTAFVVESYQSLQEDYTQTSADLLRQISQRLLPVSGSGVRCAGERVLVREPASQPRRCPVRHLPEAVDALVHQMDGRHTR
jgi:hypothetical protein